MIEKIKRKLTGLFFVLAVFLIYPGLLYAQDQAGGGNQAGSGRTGGGGSFENPLGPNTDLACFVYKIVEIIFKVGFLVAVIFIILSGLKFVMARGNEQELQKAKKMFTYVILGSAILLGAFVIINAIIATLRQIGADIGSLGGC